MANVSLKAFVLVSAILYSGVSGATTYLAPVEDAVAKPAVKPTVKSVSKHRRSSPRKIHIVKKGNTIYSIARRYGVDLHALIKRNHLHSPYALSLGQKITITGTPSKSHPPKKIAKRGIKKQKPLSNRVSLPVKAVPYHVVKTWYWPTQGKVINTFNLGQGQKGIDIAGRVGQPILAAAAGKVAYSGNGLRGYGNLLIIKHNNDYLSAYAHNRELLVKEGQWVKAKQKIAVMGKTDSKRIQLHFEIRKSGRPINPMKYLPRRVTP